MEAACAPARPAVTKSYKGAMLNQKEDPWEAQRIPLENSKVLERSAMPAAQQICKADRDAQIRREAHALATYIYIYGWFIEKH